MEDYRESSVIAAMKAISKLFNQTENFKAYIKAAKEIHSIGKNARHDAAGHESAKLHQLDKILNQFYLDAYHNGWHDSAMRDPKDT